MAWKSLGLLLCLVIATVAGWTGGAGWAGGTRALRTAPPRVGANHDSATLLSIPASPQQTPIIDPLPVLRPAFLPFALRGYNPQLPEPLSSTVRGYVAELRALGRERCAPATHVLLDKPEGVLGAAAIGVLHARRPGPNLDLYAGEFVEVGGTTSLAPTPCLILTEWLIEARTVKVIDLPPGGAN